MMPRTRGKRSVTPKGGNTRNICLLNLPDDVLFCIVSYCSQSSIAKLCCTCKRLNELCCHDCVWVRWKQKIQIIVNSKTGIPVSGVKEHCRLSNNWMKGVFTDQRLIRFSVKQLPWLQLRGRHLWVSNKNKIQCYEQRSNGDLIELTGRVISDRNYNDVGRFKVKDDLLVSGSRGGDISVYRCHDSKHVMTLKSCHSSDIHDVDFQGSTIVSGSRDKTIKVWSMEEEEKAALRYSIHVEDRVWSVAINPDNSTFVSGSAGLNGQPPLRLWDIESGGLISELGSGYKRGAGVLDIQYDSPHILLSCGYDTYIRMWDLRASTAECVCSWEEPFDSTIYTVQSDGSNAFVCGTSHHGLVRLWDKRAAAPVQIYYAGRDWLKFSSPVYSLCYDTGYMYVALDQGVHLLDFTKCLQAKTMAEFPLTM